MFKSIILFYNNNLSLAIMIYDFDYTTIIILELNNKVY